MKTLINQESFLNISDKSRQLNETLEKEIRILPMSKILEFQDYSAEDIQQKYFLGDLIKGQKGFYFFRKNGMNCAPGSIILFQFDNEIVASGTLKAIHKYDNPIDDIYKGSYEFFTDSIEVFYPISLQEFRVAVPAIKRFSQANQKISFSNLDNINNLIDIKKIGTDLDHIWEGELKIYIDGGKKQVTVNSYERNLAARKECIKANGCKCMICGFDFGEFYGDEFYGKIHIHHINPLYLYKEANELNPKTDLVPVCPNCHMVIHSKKNGVYSITEVKEFISKNKI